MAQTLSGLPSTVAVAVIRGGAAGAHTIDGNLRTTDTLLSVRHVTSDLVTNADLTAEFTISATNTINNAAGTDTTGHFLVVTYAKAAAAS